jgi:hypothetical protein
MAQTNSTIYQSTARYISSDKKTFEITVPKSLPIQPDWLLTKGGSQVWLDLLGRASQVGATELDSTALATLCNLLSDMAACWATGASPPVSAIGIAHKLSESLGLSGVKSRIARGLDLTPCPATENPYDKFKDGPGKPPPRK